MTPLVNAKTVLAGLKLKIEYLNPSLSMKHRCLPPHLFSKTNEGAISKDSKLAVISAGCAGISVAWAASQIGCSSRVYVPIGTPTSVTSYIRKLGGEICEMATGAAEAIQRQVRADPSWTLVEQLSDRSLSQHYEVVGTELRSQSNHLAAVVVGAGTAASVMGVAASLRPFGIKVFAVEPEEAQVLQGSPWHPHRIQGLAPPIKSELFNREMVDGLLGISSDEAWQTAFEVLHLTGEPVGPSSGACVAAARRIRELGIDGDIVAICSSSMITS